MHKTVFLCFTLALSPIAVSAQTQDGDISRGAELLGDGARLLLHGLLDELQPAAEGWAKLLEMLNDFSAYDLPEMLPNGDIIIRRREPLIPEGEGGEAPVGEDAEVEL